MIKYKTHLAVLILMIALVSATQVTNYEFTTEQNIEAQGCQVWQGSNYFPESLASCTARADMTHDPSLDYDDNLYTQDTQITGHKNFHFFILKEVPRTANHLDFAYVSYNSEDRVPDVHEVYIRNFQTRRWELVNSANVGMLDTANLDSSVTLNRDYIQNRQVWILSTGNLINSDYFSARVTYETPQIVVTN